MLALHTRLRRKDEEVIAKVMDGEAVIINLANGLYYSIDRAGAAMWEMIEEGHRLDDIAASITARYDVAAARAEDDVLRLAGELLREELVAMDGQGDGPRREAEPATQPRLPYEPPQLTAYRDMEELLALDPPTPGLHDIPWKG
jgi:hypothetical protein